MVFKRAESVSKYAPDSLVTGTHFEGPEFGKAQILFCT